jgi:DNA polymerase I-like protein with 3'-5' exonuclease and polymerase domains
MHQLSGKWLNWQWCTYGLYKQIATEGYPGQKHGLKHAMVDLLGWDSSNEQGVDQWLIENGYVNKSSKTPKKSEMWRVPAEILGYYCAMDAEATWLLYDLFNRQVLSDPDFEVLSLYHQDIFMPNVRLIVEQKFHGIHIDIERLEAYRSKLEADIEETKQEFLELPEVAPHAEAYTEAVYAEYKQLTPKGTISKDDPRYKLNPNSKQQLEWLLFDRLGYKPTRITETGRRSVDKNSLPHFGTPGKLLVKQNKLVKELGYVKSCLSLTANGILRPSFRVPGTTTGRLAGGN